MTTIASKKVSDELQSFPNFSTALEAIEKSDSAFNAFVRLQRWVLSDKATKLEAHEAEKQVEDGGREVLRLLLQEYFNAHPKKDVGNQIQKYENIDNVINLVQLKEKREHSRTYESVFGTVTIHRNGYAQQRGSSFHPLDQEVNLPKRRYSYLLQQRGTNQVALGPYNQAMDNLHELTAGHIPKRQLEEVTKEAAVDFEAFYEQRSQDARSPEETGDIVVGGVDCKGLPRRKSPQEKNTPRKARLSKGEKRQKKKMATVASVHTQKPHIRTAEEVVEQLMDSEPPKPLTPKPRAEHRRLWASVTKSKDDVIRELGAEMKRRDPKGSKTIVCLTDGERALQKRALKYLTAGSKISHSILSIINSYPRYYTCA